MSRRDGDQPSVPGTTEEHVTARDWTLRLERVLGRLKVGPERLAEPAVLFRVQQAMYERDGGAREDVENFGEPVPPEVDEPHVFTLDHVRALPPDLAIAVLARHWLDLPVTVIAASLRRRPETVKGLLSAAMLRINRTRNSAATPPSSTAPGQPPPSYREPDSGEGGGA